LLKANSEKLIGIESMLREVLTFTKASAPKLGTGGAQLVRPPTAGAPPKPQPAVSGTLPAQPKPPASPPPSIPAPAGGDSFDAMNRKQLTDLAAASGIALQAGLKADDIRALLRNAGTAAPVEAAAEEASAETESSYPESYTQGTVERAFALIALIDANPETADPYINPESTEEGALKCGGNCTNCPNPEQFATPAEQVAACATAFHEMLGVPLPAFSD
jgi:hypothetical protein